MAFYKISKDLFEFADEPARNFLLDRLTLDFILNTCHFKLLLKCIKALMLTGDYLPFKKTEVQFVYHKEMVKKHRLFHWFDLREKWMKISTWLLK